jgi:ribonuclease D
MFDQLVQTHQALERLCQHLQGEPWIALDTEFVRERTYYARFCLIQLATPSLVACIDPLALESLEPLLQPLYAPEIVKVLHAARQDLELFYDLQGTPPTPVHDTQVAAALLGYQDQISYASLVQDLLGTRLEKHYTRTDWSRRPLSAAQLRYAEDDVRYLRDLYPLLMQKLAAQGRDEWLAEECARLTDTRLYQNDPDTAYARIKQRHTLPPAGQQVLRALARWRELTAQQLNRPRTWIMRDAELLELARQQPRSEGELAAISAVTHSNAKKWGATLVAEIAKAVSLTPTKLWHVSPPLNARQLLLYERMHKLVRTRARERQLSPTLIASRKDLQALVRGESADALLAGWRRAVVGEELLAMREAELPCAGTS